MDSHARSNDTGRAHGCRAAILLVALVGATGCHVGELLSSPGDRNDDQSPWVPGPGGSYTLAIVAGDAQRDTVGATLGKPYSVRVIDANGRPESGVTVRWIVVDGDGSVDRGQSTTDAMGIARATHTLGTSLGSHAVQASVAGINGSPRRFTATAVHGAPDRFTYEVGPSNSVMGEPIAPAIRVMLRDRLGNIVDGLGGSATIALVSGTGTPLATLNGTLAVPIASGLATFDNVRVSLVGVGYRVRVSFADVGAPSVPFDVALMSPP